MNRPGTALVAAAAMTGLMAGAAQVSAQGTLSATSIGVIAHHSISDQHTCKGQNSCKGQGGCQSGDNGCRGKNSCKGKGGCNTKPPMAAYHAAGGTVVLA